jgi:ribosome biogenesis GTPase
MSQTGLLTARHRRHVVVQLPGGDRLQCLVRGRRLKPLVGDSVDVDRLKDGTSVISHIEPRTSVLMRIDRRGRPEGVAANITQLAIVIAAEPAPDWLLVDRYLAAAELQNITGLVIWNKADLLPLCASEQAQVYGKLGYGIVETSAKKMAGIVDLEQAMVGHRSVLVGQSGVGKSSLINALLGIAAQTVGSLSAKRPIGKHTTTGSELHRLPAGGELIDSPGVRQYAPYLDEPERLDWAFCEFRPYLGHCRFDNCNHEAEPGCAVKRAVEAGSISAARYAGFLQLRQVLTALRRR